MCGCGAAAAATPFVPLILLAKKNHPFRTLNYRKLKKELILNSACLILLPCCMFVCVCLLHVYVCSFKKISKKKNKLAFQRCSFNQMKKTGCCVLYNYSLSCLFSFNTHTHTLFDIDLLAHFLSHHSQLSLYVLCCLAHKLTIVCCVYLCRRFFCAAHTMWPCKQCKFTHDWRISYTHGGTVGSK